MSRQDLDAFDELMAPDLAEESKREMSELLRTFPDYHGADEIQIAEGDMVAGRFVFYGTHQGEFMGVPPTGRQVTFKGLSLIKVVNGKIVEFYSDKTDRFFETFFGLAQDGKLNEKGLPSLLQMAVSVPHFGDEIRLANPPWAVQRALFGILAPVGRMLGYRAEYPYLYGERGEEPFVSEGK